MMWILILILFVLSIYAISVVEHWSVYRRWDFAHPFSAFAFSFTQEDIKPRMHDKTFLQTAPILFIVAAVLFGGSASLCQRFHPCKNRYGSTFYQRCPGLYYGSHAHGVAGELMVIIP